MRLAGPVRRGWLFFAALGLAVAGLVAGAGATGAGQAEPRPAATPTAAPEAPRSASTPDRDTATVCATTARTVTAGLHEFVATMQKVSLQAGQGDLVGAQSSVEDAGAYLIAMAAQLRKDAAGALDMTVKNTIGELANEFDRLGRSLDDLTSIHDFDASRVDALARTMKTLCEATPTPSPSR